MSLPELGPEQRRKALEKAAEARRIRAELKQMLKAGEVTLGDVLARAEETEPLAKMRVSEVIESMPNYGKVKARRLMERLDISTSRRLRGLGSNQRAALLAEFGEKRPS
ncbi:MAG: integration host factor [Actinomycetota bacterium]|nr:integration host factor [Actinomycetota bacterium]